MNEKLEAKKHDEAYVDEMINWIDERILNISSDKLTVEYLQNICKIHQRECKNIIDSMSLSISYMDKQIIGDPMMPGKVKKYLAGQLELHTMIKIKKPPVPEKPKGRKITNYALDKKGK